MVESEDVSQQAHDVVLTLIRRCLDASNVVTTLKPCRVLTVVLKSRHIWIYLVLKFILLEKNFNFDNRCQKDINCLVFKLSNVIDNSFVTMAIHPTQGLCFGQEYIRRLQSRKNVVSYTDGPLKIKRTKR